MAPSPRPRDDEQTDGEEVVDATDRGEMRTTVAPDRGPMLNTAIGDRAKLDRRRKCRTPGCRPDPAVAPAHDPEQCEAHYQSRRGDVVRPEEG